MIPLTDLLTRAARFDERAARQAATDCFHAWATLPEYEPLPEDLALDLVSRLRGMAALQHRTLQPLLEAYRAVAVAAEDANAQIKDQRGLWPAEVDTLDEALAALRKVCGE